MFENSIVHGIHKSRYVASWVNSGGKFIDERRGIRSRYEFANWLATLVIDGTELTDDEIDAICNYATNGKMELEFSAKAFLRKNKES